MGVHTPHSGKLTYCSCTYVFASPCFNEVVSFGMYLSFQGTIAAWSTLLLVVVSVCCIKGVLKDFVLWEHPHGSASSVLQPPSGGVVVCTLVENEGEKVGTCTRASLLSLAFFATTYFVFGCVCSNSNTSRTAFLFRCLPMPCVGGHSSNPHQYLCTHCTASCVYVATSCDVIRVCLCTYFRCLQAELLYVATSHFCYRLVALVQCRRLSSMLVPLSLRVLIPQTAICGASTWRWRGASGLGCLRMGMAFFVRCDECCHPYLPCPVSFLCRSCFCCRYQT